MSKASNPDKAGITVTTVIATYNRAHYLPEALRSILEQTRAADEIIVVDDGSTDQTQSVVERYGPRIRYIKKPNGGRASALNMGIREARGTHIWHFDDDDVALPDALQHHTEFLAAHPDIDYSHSQNFVFEGDEGIWDAQRWRLNKAADCPPDELLARMLEDSCAPLQGMLIPLHCLQEVGLFNEQLLRAQDYDLMLRLARRFRGAHIARPTFVLREHGGTRGGAGTLHAAGDRWDVWQHYNKEIFAGIRRDFALAEYLPKDPATPQAALSPEQAFRALCRRAEIMFVHGLFAQGAKDVRRLLQDESGSDVHGHALEALVTKAANINVAQHMDDAPALARHLGKAFNGSAHAKKLIRCTLRGFYWSLRRAWRTRQHKQALHLAAAMAIMAWSRLDQNRAAVKPLHQPGTRTR